MYTVVAVVIKKNKNKNKELYKTIIDLIICNFSIRRTGHFLTSAFTNKLPWAIEKRYYI
jgi:hypothetical protein